ncbi:uncharacterized protein LOC112490439 [Ziziphus jujuba]|uniref:Uncharacterized protein LOC112490439 n=2 Tax=Ziziphus jujuba TaxID=326968 RepID=A0A6P6FWX9_ZIZJJ|nr:uncharacterized protein LOC112490439 [Ziziphus jujuba]KAH7511911.1 hypothetical protein FEM48_Zijuj12G0033400 [Ziziphus jujuba var. spinosa]
MLLRKSISGTKKFFQKTLGGLKSLFSKGDYEKLPKSSPQNNAFSYTTAAVADVNHVHTNYKDLDKFYTELAQEYWDNIHVEDHQSKRKIITTATSTPTKQDHREFDQSGNLKKLAHNSSPVKVMKNNNMETQQRRVVYPNNHNINKVKKNRREEEEEEEMGERRSWLVEEKLKELEMLDISNVDHVLDIEEVLHYYSRLTCPAYLEIVDKFFLDIYAEFFKPPPVSATRINSSRLRPRTSFYPRS